MGNLEISGCWGGPDPGFLFSSFLCRILSLCQSSKLGTPRGSVLELLLLPLDVTYLGNSLIIQSLWSPPFLAHGSQTSLSVVLGPTLVSYSRLHSPV